MIEKLQYYSQDGQDEFLVKIFKNKKNGYFLDVGAYDGVKFSNTFFMEKNLEWKGICIEPNPQVFSQLIKNRQCIALNCCISEVGGNYSFLSVSGWGEMLSGILEFLNPAHLERIDDTIKKNGGTKTIMNLAAKPIKSILSEKNISSIDYCNIDVEGGELSVLKSIDFSLVRIKVFTIENNYKADEVKKYLYEKGYKRIWRIGADDVYEYNSHRYMMMLKFRYRDIKENAAKLYRQIFNRN